MLKFFQKSKNTKTEKKIYKHGWYSKKQFIHTAGESWVYTDKKGNNVLVTMVSEQPTHDTMWDDVIYKGEVDKWVSYIPPRDRDPLFFGLLTNNNLTDIRREAALKKAEEDRKLKESEPKRGAVFNFWV